MKKDIEKRIKELEKEVAEGGKKAQGMQQQVNELQGNIQNIAVANTSRVGAIEELKALIADKK